MLYSLPCTVKMMKYVAPGLDYFLADWDCNCRRLGWPYFPFSFGEAATAPPKKSQPYQIQGTPPHGEIQCAATEKMTGYVKLRSPVGS
jgi:hypothetical protein